MGDDGMRLKFMRTDGVWFGVEILDGTVSIGLIFWAILIHYGRVA